MVLMLRTIGAHAPHNWCYQEHDMEQAIIQWIKMVGKRCVCLIVNYKVGF